ncbi:hypothetical protein BCR34DRAFT_99406 [Clohesyomyces aquaticus]|uniref:Uncharacterized protein n=1 Tax=Clohesyomyces aquaticus TaxID=1231657 RepID=A0A1Y1YU61_9PLEO|nr:hypothetical protein BCR34DRAFT_99406 [Clohesyomyces aquaticus]
MFPMHVCWRSLGLASALHSLAKYSLALAVLGFLYTNRSRLSVFATFISSAAFPYLLWAILSSAARYGQYLGTNTVSPSPNMALSSRASSAVPLLEPRSGIGRGIWKRSFIRRSSGRGALCVDSSRKVSIFVALEPISHRFISFNCVRCVSPVVRSNGHTRIQGLSPKSLLQNCSFDARFSMGVIVLSLCGDVGTAQSRDIRVCRSPQLNSSPSILQLNIFPPHAQKHPHHRSLQSGPHNASP